MIQIALDIPLLDNINELSTLLSFFPSRTAQIYDRVLQEKNTIQKHILVAAP